MNEEEKKYKSGFNHGYLLAKYEPVLANLIVNSLRPSQNEYAIGLSTGYDAYNIEKIARLDKEINPKRPDQKKEKKQQDIEKTKEKLRKFTKTSAPAKATTIPVKGRTK